MNQISGINYDLNEVLDSCLNFLNQKLNLLDKSEQYIINLYEKSLYRINKPSTFEVEGKIFLGIIRGVSSSGLLKVQLDDQKISLFDLKSIKLKN